jgi:putative FmdB family regulatory protein
MALYEYLCENKKCKHKMEKIVFNKDEEKALVCEKCQGKKLKKILSVCSPPDIRGYSYGNGYSKKPE